MAAISAANVVLLLDKLTAQWSFLLGVSGGNGVGDGTFGGSKKQADLAVIIAALNDVSQEAVLAPIASGFPSYSAASQFKQQNGGLLTALNQAAVASGLSGVGSWDQLLTYYNVTNGPFNWATLASPDYLAAMQALGPTPSPLNVYLEVLQGASWQGTTFTNALRKNVKATGTDTNTAGYTVDPTKFAGGFPFLNVAALTGSGVVTVVGLNQSGVSETYTVTISGTGRVALVPGTTSTDLITAVTSVATAAGITAATMYVEANRPSGRTNPPT